MIDPNWSVIDLDPHTWRAIGHFFDPGQYIRAAQPEEHGLFVLHDAGRITRVVDTERGVRRDLALSSAEDPDQLAGTLFATGEWTRVHVIDKQHLANVARVAQKEPRRDLNLDEYYRLVYSLVWDGSDGYVTMPPPAGAWHGWTYTDLLKVVGVLPDPTTVALVVMDGEKTEIGLVLDIYEGHIRTLTTLETFSVPAPTFKLSEAGLGELWDMLQARGEKTGAPQPAAVLLCSKALFDGLIEAVNKAGKWELLKNAIEQKDAFVRMQVRE